MANPQQRSASDHRLFGFGLQSCIQDLQNFRVTSPERRPQNDIEASVPEPAVTEADTAAPANKSAAVATVPLLPHTAPPPPQAVTTITEMPRLPPNKGGAAGRDVNSTANPAPAVGGTLKKKTVKMVGPAGPARAPTPAPQPANASTPAPQGPASNGNGNATNAPTEATVVQTVNHGPVVPAANQPRDVAVAEKKNAADSDDEESEVEKLFARLRGAGQGPSKVAADAAPKATADAAPKATADTSPKVTADAAPKVTADTSKVNTAASKATTGAKSENVNTPSFGLGFSRFADVPNKAEKDDDSGKATKPDNGTGVDIKTNAGKLPPQAAPVEAKTAGTLQEGVSNHTLALEKYLKKATELFDLMITRQGTSTSASLFKAVADEMQKHRADADAARTFVAAIKKYIDSDANRKPIDVKVLEKIVQESNGEFLLFCSNLVNEKVIAIDSLDELAGLCSALLKDTSSAPIEVATPESPCPRLVPSGLNPATANKGASKPTATTHNMATPIVHQNKMVDPMENATSWPKQILRENVAGSRTMLLKGPGIGRVTSFHTLQALVWGGKVESLTLPDTNKTFALVKFMTLEGCENYFKATPNGVDILEDGKPKTFVLTERTTGPDSANDLLRNCTESGATRCVRAVDVDEDWNEPALYKLAAGNGKFKRDIDIVKRGKTSTGRHYVEFRFTSVYNGLNFHRELSNDEEWERCYITYAEDPCEKARGVHLKDESEDKM